MPDVELLGELPSVCGFGGPLHDAEIEWDGRLKKNVFLNELNRLQNNVCLGKSITE